MFSQALEHLGPASQVPQLCGPLRFRSPLQDQILSPAVPWLFRQRSTQMLSETHSFGIRTSLNYGFIWEKKSDDAGFEIEQIFWVFLSSINMHMLPPLSAGDGPHSLSHVKEALHTLMTSPILSFLKGPAHSRPIMPSHYSELHSQPSCQARLQLTMEYDPNCAFPTNVLCNVKKSQEQLFISLQAI